MTSAYSFSSWTAALTARGLAVLPSSHAVPVQLWARERDGGLLHFTARGTVVALRRYRSNDLTGLILRAECDCEEHRTAGARQRTVLIPGTAPLAEEILDGREEFGWSGIEAGLLDVPSAASLFDRLLEQLPVEPSQFPVPAVDVSDPATRNIDGSSRKARRVNERAGGWYP